ncbi:MAG: DUF1579 family protein [Planctomycetota bacterium]
MGRPLLAVFLLTLFSFHCSGDQPNRSPELLLLDRFVGDWVVKLEVEVNGEIVQRPQYESHIQWSRDGTFVIANEIHENREQLMVMRFDTAQRAYRGAFFSSTEQTPFTADWDEAKQTFTLEFEEAEDADASMVYRFRDKDEIEVRIGIRGKDGKANATVTGTQTRFRKKPPQVRATPKIEFRLAEEAAAPGLEKKSLPDSEAAVYVHPERLVTRPDILSAQFFVEETGIPTFRFHLKPEGARRLGIATRDNLGKSLAILVDDQLIHAPRIQSMITERAQMSGNFTQAMIDKFVPVKSGDSER